MCKVYKIACLQEGRAAVWRRSLWYSVLHAFVSNTGKLQISRMSCCHLRAKLVTRQKVETFRRTEARLALVVECVEFKNPDNQSMTDSIKKIPGKCTDDRTQPADKRNTQCHYHYI